MPEVQNIGTTDYNQYQPSQYTAYEENYTTQPDVYDEAMVEKRAAASSMKGAAITAIIIAAGLGLLGGHYWGAKGKSAANEAKEKAIEALDKTKQSLDKFKSVAEDLGKKADEVTDSFWGCGGKDLAKDVKTKFTDPYKEEASKLEKLINEVKEGGEEVAEETKKAAEEAA